MVPFPEALYPPEFGAEGARGRFGERIEAAVVFPREVPEETLPIEFEGGHSIAKTLIGAGGRCSNGVP
jgi:hypothetical protein